MSLRDDLSVPVKEAEIGDLLSALHGIPDLAMVVRRLAFQRPQAGSFDPTSTYVERASAHIAGIKMLGGHHHPCNCDLCVAKLASLAADLADGASSVGANQGARTTAIGTAETEFGLDQPWSPQDMMRAMARALLAQPRSPLGGSPYDASACLLLRMANEVQDFAMNERK